MRPDDVTPQDPILESEIERAIAPYREILSAEMLDHFRETLREALLFHPVGRRLLNRVRPVPVLAESDVVSGRDQATAGGQAAVLPEGGVREGDPPEGEEPRAKGGVR